MAGLLISFLSTSQMLMSSSSPLASLFFFTNQNDFPSTVMTRSGLSLEELRIVEGQGQSSEVITPSEELNRITDMGMAARPTPLHSYSSTSQPTGKHIWQMVLLECKGGLKMFSYGNETDAVCLVLWRNVYKGCLMSEQQNVPSI